MHAHRLTKPGQLSLVEIDPPGGGDLESGEALLDTLVGGICGSDLPYFAGRLPLSLPRDTSPGSAGTPGFPLHEIVGTIAASRSARLPVGARVVGWAARTNALAERVIVRGDDVLEYASVLAPIEAIVLQPLACALDTLDQIGDLRGRSVAIIGLGPMGLLLAHAAKSRGARRVIGVDPVDRTDCAARFHVDEFAHSTSDRWTRLLAPDDRPDVVIEAVGHQVGTVRDALEAVAAEGTVFAFGIPDDDVYPVPMLLMLRKNLTLISGVVALDRRLGALRQAEQYVLEHGELRRGFITHVESFARAQEAFELASLQRPGRLKVAIEMDR